MTEAQLQKKCVSYCWDNDVMAYKMDASTRGFPDLLIIFENGHTAFVELKSPSGTGRLSAMQINIIQKLTDRHVDVQVIDSFDAFADFIKERINADA
jgi:hypothetical protein